MQLQAPCGCATDIEEVVDQCEQVLAGMLNDGHATLLIWGQRVISFEQLRIAEDAV